MRVELLGTGTSTGVPEIGCDCEVCTSSDPHDNRLRTAALVSTCGKEILIDCGPDFRQQMLRAGKDKLDAVLLTHEHYDHTAGLDDLRPFCRYRSVPVYLESRVADVIRMRMPYCFAENRYPGVPDIRLKEIGTDPFLCEGIPVIPIRAMHYRLPVLGFRIGDMAYITDLWRLPEEELPKLKGLKVLFINALRKTKHLSHQSLDEALALTGRIRPGHTYLLHMSHQIGLHARVAAELPPGVTLGYDGLVMETE